jgi:streptogramin lyase
MAANNPGTPAGTVSRTVSGTTANVALAKPTNQVMVTSLAANAIAFVAFGSTSAVVAVAATDTPILPGSVQVFSIPAVAGMYAAAIGSAGTLYFTSLEGS